MTPSLRALFALTAAVLATLPPVARAEGVAFRFARTLLADEKEVRLKAPEGVGCAEDGRVVVADTGNGRLVTARLEAGGFAGATEVKVAELKHPTRVALDAKGGTWVLDRRARKLARLGPGYAFAGWVEPKGAPGFDPVAFALTAAGAAVLDASGPAVVELDPAGAELRRVALPKGQWTDLWVDAQGTVFALEAVAAQVFIAARADAAFKPLTRSLKDAMNFPAALVSNGRGRLFAVDQHGMGIVVLGLDGSYQGRQLAMGWGNGLLYYPAQLCVTSRGEALLADRGNNRVQLFTTLE